MALIKLNSRAIPDSTVVNTDIADGSISTAKLADDAVTGAKLYAENLGRRNLIINGAMQVWQRGTSRAFSNTQYVTVDRFQPGQYQQAGYERVEVVNPGPQAQYALRVTSSNTSEAASGTRMSVGQMIESVNSIHTAGQTVTLSFWIKFSAASIASAGNFTVRIWEFDSINPSFITTGPTRNTGIDLTNGSLPTSWTKYTVTVTTASTAKTLVARFSFIGLFNTTNNSDFSYDITEIQLEQGDTATPFEHRSFGEELSLCQRYYEQGDLSQRQSGSIVRIGQSYHTKKRANATVNVYYDINKAAAGTINVSNTTNSGWNVGGATNFWNMEKSVGGNPDSVDYNCFWTASAEL